MRLTLPLILTLLATSVLADTSSQIAENGLQQTIVEFSTKADKTPSDQFTLGTLHFMRGVEKTLQTRWEYNATLDDLDLPVLRLPVEPNPMAKPFKASLIIDIFTELRGDMQASRDAMADIPKAAALELNLDLHALWFDVNMNGKRDPDEGVMIYAASMLMPSWEMQDVENTPSMIVRFDTADRAWLTAYTHMLSATSEMVIAFDPTEAIASVMESTAKMNALRRPTDLGFAPLGEIMTSINSDRFGSWADQIAMTYGALNQKPDAIHTRAAHAHLLEMIAQNKLFWAALEAETDNDNEWIPNSKQAAALGFEVPAETGLAWQAVLADAEALLNGDLLIDYWRTSPNAGVNVKKLFMDPPVVDIVTWVQGSGLLPYLERGPIITARSLNQFDDLTGGNIFLFSFLLN